MEIKKSTVKKINASISILKNKQKMYENSGFKYKGVKLTYSDTDTIISYLNRYKDTGGYLGLMEPCGGVKQILDSVVS